MKKLIGKFMSDESGVTSVEYALLAVAATTVVGVAGSGFYGTIKTTLEGIDLTSGTGGSAGQTNTGN